jgi:hypothetical protein
MFFLGNRALSKLNISNNSIISTLQLDIQRICDSKSIACKVDVVTSHVDVPWRW